ncbi:hypothetical protein [Halorientalis regularis]|jgi:hypothetical protein|uniref:DUF6199 domain-containing protein n=1 Tax=Halorientalis regularis TaxID=660518 RepID=A0A1G7J6J1_9EURY|nr:hypothetical protein [Halorientalis regularis]SDF20540.1 hypothetical protein SAMN05216218_104222 [Halorientalis regularis]
MVTEKLRRLSYGWLLVQGLLAAASPKRSIQLNAKLWGLAFENTGELKPKPWYVRSVRAAGVGMLAAGGVGLLLEDRASEDEEAEAAEEPDEPITVETDDD